MPRGDGTGPLETGPLGWGRGGCLNKNRFGMEIGLGLGRKAAWQANAKTAGNTHTSREDLEAQASRLEQQAERLRSLAKSGRID